MSCPTPKAPAPYVLAVTGASGAPYARGLLRVLPPHGTLHVVASRAGRDLYRMECGAEIEEDLPEGVHLWDAADWRAPFASGSYPVSGMVICPCTMGTLGAVAGGFGENVIHRAADVCLKERRRLVLVPRETPLSRIHLENMLRVTEAGAVVLPASPGFYHRPGAVSDLVDFIVARILDLLGIAQTLMAPWNPESPA